MREVLSKNSNNNPIIIMIPVFNDWQSLEMLLICLDQVLDAQKVETEILVVDDGSNISIPNNCILPELKNIRQVNMLKLRRNIGHQRAIAIGLAYIEENIPCQAVVVMDGDGEDEPSDVVRLIEECAKEEYKKVVFAKRTKRSESWLFKIFYFFYKSLYKSLIGQEISVGNFSIIPYKILRRLVAVSELWNHYAAAVLKARVPYIQIPSKRGRRLAGQSKMNFVSLVIHGLSAISVYGDIVGVRLLVATCFLIVFTLIGIVVILSIRLATNLAIPGWASSMVSVLFVIFIQAIMVSMFFIFTILNGRNYSSFIPQRDYHHFVLEFQKFLPNDSIAKE